MEFTNDDGNVLEAFKCSKPDSSNTVEFWSKLFNITSKVIFQIPSENLLKSRVTAFGFYFGTFLSRGR